MLNQLQESFNNLLIKLSTWLDNLILILPNLILAAIFLVVSIYLSRLLRTWTHRVLHKTPVKKSVKELLSNLVVTIFMLLALFIILNILNLSEAITALLGTAGVAGLAIGLALQTPLMNLFSGVLLSVRNFYKVGDLVETNGFFGAIQKINLRSTILLTPDGQEVVIPNKDVLDKPLKNYSHTSLRRIDIACGVGYGDDLEKAKKVAIRAIENCDLKIVDHRPVELFFTEFGDSSVNFSLRFWQNISTQRDYLAAKNIAIIALKNAFDHHSISIPFPIRTLDLSGLKGGQIEKTSPLQKLSIN